MTAKTMGEVSIRVKVAGDERWQTVAGMNVSRNFAVTEPTKQDFIEAHPYQLTHRWSGYRMGDGVDNVTQGRKLARALEKLGDWSKVKEPADVPPELSEAAIKVVYG